MLTHIKNCQNCSLHTNQPPLLHNTQKAQAMWVGLSAVRVDDVDEAEPLAANTNSGRLISEIEDLNQSVEFYRTNLVKCLPIKEGKIRYPSSSEAKACVDHLILELEVINPKVVFLLGKQVSDFVKKNFAVKNDCPKHLFDYQAVEYNGIKLIPIHHPSYILVYKRARIAEYKDAITNIICNSYGDIIAPEMRFDDIECNRFNPRYQHRNVSPMPCVFQYSVT